MSTLTDNYDIDSQQAGIHYMQIWAVMYFFKLCNVLWNYNYLIRYCNLITFLLSIFTCN